jgi:hypothetical protein
VRPSVPLAAAIATPRQVAASRATQSNAEIDFRERDHDRWALCPLRPRRSSQHDCVWPTVEVHVCHGTSAGVLRCPMALEKEFECGGQGKRELKVTYLGSSRTGPGVYRRVL